MARFGDDEPRATDRTGLGIDVPRDRPLDGLGGFWGRCLRARPDVAAGDVEGGECGFGVRRQTPPRPPSTRLASGWPARDTHASRRISMRPRNCVDSAASAPLALTRPLIVTVPEVPSWDVASTLLSED
jgi:hypothetical protein